MSRNDRVIVNSGAATADGRPVHRTAWGAVIAGALTALMITLLLTLLFGGLGLNSFDPATEADPVGNGTGSIIALVVTNLLSLFVGGWVAGRLAGSPRRSDSVIHGILTWGVLTLATLFLLSSAVGRLVGGAANLLGSSVSTVAQLAPEAGNALGNVLPNVDVQAQVNGFLTEAGVQNPEQTGQELVQRVTERVQNGESLTSPDAQEELTTFLAENSELTEQEIETQVQEFTQEAEQTAQEVQTAVTEGAEQATDTAGTAALLGFAALLLGAIVAAIGATVGSPKDGYEARA